jgi:hypothetical protein
LIVSTTGFFHIETLTELVAEDPMNQSSEFLMPEVLSDNC